MWVGTKTFNELTALARWKVEFFCDPVEDRVSDVFPLVPLREIVWERRETLEPQEHPTQLFNYVGLENVQTLTGDLIAFEPRPGQEIRSRSKVFKPQDILYGRLRPYLNKVFIADCQEVHEGICSAEFFVLIVNKQRIRPHVLRSILASDYILNIVKKYQSGMALPRLHKSDFLDITIPVPPMDMQAEIEDFLLKANEYRRRLAAELELLPTLTMNKLVNTLKTGNSLLKDDEF